MGKKTIAKFEFSFLIMAALCFEVLLIERTFHVPPVKKSWTEARLFCQKYHTDLITREDIMETTLAGSLKSVYVNTVWVGLHRDPMHDSVWKWINVITGEGLAGPDVSSSLDWEGNGHDSHCAAVGAYQLWHSKLCWKRYIVHCSAGNRTFSSPYGKSWHEGLRYCQSKKGNISVVSAENSNNFRKPGWIGLHRQAGSKWVWVGNSSSTYTNWAAGEPVTKDCGSFKSFSRRFNSYECSTELKFVCYDENVVVVKENKTWEHALKHCKNITHPCFDLNCTSYSEILNLGHSEDYDYFRGLVNKATTDEVWIGLQFLGRHWLWMNGQTPDDQGKLPSCPPQKAHCGTLSKNDTKNWSIRDCAEKRNFVCYRQTTYFRTFYFRT